jgi:branched-chain amino acid transport system substrate-binding protein
MSRLRRVRPLALALAVSLPTLADSDPAPAPRPSAVRLIGLDIQTSTIGRKAREGYELAVEVANRNGGVKVGGRTMQVQLMMAEDPEKAPADEGAAIPLLEELVARNHPVAILQNYVGLASAYGEQAALAERLRIPWVNSGTASKGIFGHGRKFSFGVLSPISKIPDSILRWIDEMQKEGKLKPKLKVALVWTEQSGVNAQEFRAGALESLGRTPSRRSSYEIVLEQQLQSDPHSYTLPAAASVASVVKELAARSPDVLLAYANLEGYLELQRAIVARKLCFDLASYGPRGAEAEAAAALGESGTNYLFSVVWWTPEMRQTPKGKEFLEAFRAKHGRTPEWYQAVSYESVRAVLAAVERAGSLDPVQVRDQLALLRMESLVPGGSLSFPEEYGQEAQYPMLVLQNQPGEGAPVVYPGIAAQKPGIAPNPRCQR